MADRISPNPPPGWLADLQGLFTWRMVLYAWLPCLLITFLHYGTGPGLAWVHDVLRRLYYLPILFAAFTAGSRGAVALSVFASLVYLPHAFGDLANRDPANALQKGLEVFLYNGIAVTAGLLVDRERREREKQRALAGKLSEALEEQRRVETQLIRAGRLGALGELTAGIAHEIRNPLHAMKGSAEILRDVVPEGVPERRMLDLHMVEIDRLVQAADRFLAFARPAPSVRAPLDLREPLGRVVSLLSVQGAKEGVEVAEEPWGGAAPPVVEGDGHQLAQLFLNLGINALQAMKGAGPGRLSYAVREERQGGKAYFVAVVSNTGPPIPEERLERIFDPFFTTRDDGTGLGLSICSRIADGHDGVLSVRNLPGGAGVEFTLALPAAPDPDRDPGTVSPS
jgi:signal transduction histidine kinase